MAAQVGSQQRKIPYHVEYLVPRRFVGAPKRVVDWSRPPEYQQIGCRRACAQPLTPEFDGLAFQKEGPAAGQFVCERLGRDHLSVKLTIDRCRHPIVEGVADLQLIPEGRVESKRGATLRDDDRRIDAQNRASRGLQDDAGPPERLDKTLSGAVQAGRLRGIQLDVTVIDAQARQRRQDMFDQGDLSRRLAQSGAALRTRHLFYASRDLGRRA